MKLFTVDAFTDRAFGGNPAAICLPQDEPSAQWMQSLAAEMNLSETAFLRPAGENRYHLRWFTPTVEVDLCGHATLASAHVLWTEQIASADSEITFETLSGPLVARKSNGNIELDFPSQRAEQVSVTSELVSAIGASPTWVGSSRLDNLIVLDSERALRELQPDFTKLARIETRGFIVTARSENGAFDFVSRYFAPGSGIDEDPVTGSAHCCLGPYWSDLLGKSELTGFQASARGGIVKVRLEGDRALLSGQAVTVLRGELADAVLG